MREIKFRVYHKNLKKMLDAKEWHHYGPHLVSGELTSNDHEIMQYTGLKDKHGKEIYEGDILKRGEGISFVVWGLDGWRFNSWMPEGMNLYTAVDTTVNKEVAEIIGNIYEHKHLLK